MTLRHKVGVVTVTYNSGKVIDEFLMSLLAQTHQQFLLYLVDNASQDDTRERVKAFTDSRIILVQNQNNLGFAAGTNLGIHAALESGCDSVLIINNDTAFEPQLIEKLIAGMLEHACQLAVPKMLYYREPCRIWAAGGAIPWWRGFRAQHFGVGQDDRGQFDTPRRVTFAPLCCTLISSDIFRRIGYLDANYFVYFEDVDFMYRAMKAKCELIYLPNATLRHHVHALTGGRTSEFTFCYNNRNYTYFLLKRFGLWRTLPLLVVNQGYFLARLLLCFDTPSAYVLRQTSLRNGFRLYKQWKNDRTLPAPQNDAQQKSTS